MRSAVGATPETDAAPYTGTGEPPATEQMPAPDPRRAGSAACLLRPAAARLTGGCDDNSRRKVQNVRRDSTARRCGELWLPMTTDHSKTRRMTSQSPSPVSEDSEEERAFLQARVALFWKVIFFIILLGSGLGAVGAVAKPGVDLLLTSGFDRQCRHLLVAVPARGALDPVLSADGERRSAAQLDHRRACWGATCWPASPAISRS